MGGPIVTEQYVQGGDYRDLCIVDLSDERTTLVAVVDVLRGLLTASMSTNYSQHREIERQRQQLAALRDEVRTMREEILLRAGVEAA